MISRPSASRPVLRNTELRRTFPATPPCPAPPASAYLDVAAHRVWLVHAQYWYLELTPFFMACRYTPTSQCAHNPIVRSGTGRNSAAVSERQAPDRLARACRRAQ